MDIGDWLRGLGLERYAEAFRASDVGVDVLPDLTDTDLKELGVSLGDRKRLLKAALMLQEQGHGPVPPSAVLEKGREPLPVAEPTAERRQLTVMFADLVGSTELSRRLDPEEMALVLQTYRAAVAAEVARFEGHVAKLMGDGVLAYFGWPRAHEDDAERAVRAALALVAVVGRVTVPALAGTPLAARVGIATGPVVVGDLVGAEEARERAVVGETPNLAARLQALAEPGAVIVAEGTQRLLGSLFELADLGARELHGFAEPVHAWRALREAPAEGHFEALHGTARLTPLVGREHELALLLDRWEQAREGDGQVVLLSGEAGIGKSRLVRALRERLSGGHTALSQFCSPYHTNTALHPVIGLLERAAGLHRDEPPERQRERLAAALARATADVAESAALLADLLGIPAGGSHPVLQLNPQQKKERTFRALLDQLGGLAAQAPVLALYEDVHWADPTTVELIGQVIEAVQRLPVLALVTFRPEFAPPWAGHGHVTALSLSRLARRQGGAMVERLTGGRVLPPDVLEQILARTDGVPLFVEELTKAVLESGLLRDAGDRYELAGPLPPLAIPATLQDSLMARLDRLAPVKEVAQVAAVIGREFSHALLEAVAPVGGEALREALGQFEAAGLIFARGAGAGYAFKHALVRDVAYRSLLRSRRVQLHARITEALEERFPVVASAEPELLARHSAGAGLADRAARHWLRAAKLAIARSANLEAIVHCGEAEVQLRMLPSSAERARAELEVQFAKGVAVRAGKGYCAPEAERTFLRACELSEGLSDRGALTHALRGLWAFYYVAGRWEDAARVAERIGAAVEGLEDRAAQCIRWYVDGATRLYTGQPAEAVRRLEESLRYYDEGDRGTYIAMSGLDMATQVRSHLALAAWLAGRPEQAARTTDEAVEIARRITSPFSLVEALFLSGVLRMMSREWDATAELAAEAREASGRFGVTTHAAIALTLMGIAEAARADPARGTGLAAEGITSLHQVGWACLVPLLQAYRAAALSAGGDQPAALETAATALRMVRTSGELAWEAEALRVLAEVRHAEGRADPAEVEADLRAAVEVARRQGARSFELRAAMSLARLWADRGECRKAHDLLAAVYHWFTEGLDTPDLIEAKELLDAL